MLLAAALLGLGLTHQAAQRLDTTHVLFAAVVSLGLAPLSLFILLPQSSIGLAGRGRAVYALAVVALAVPEVFRVSTNNCAAPFPRRKNRFSCCSVSAVFRSNRSDSLAPLARCWINWKNRRPRNNASLSGHSIFVVPTTTILLSII
jgi:hypothetical protein